MKKILTGAILLSSLAVNAKDVIWKGDRHILEVNTQEFDRMIDPRTGQKVIQYTCLDQERLVLDGKVKLSHPEENIYDDLPSKVIVKCYDIHFTEAAHLLTDSELRLYVTNDLSGDVRIESTRGVKGPKAPDQTYVYASRAKDGAAGKAGANGDHAKCGLDMRPGTGGNPGMDGGHAQHGNRGKDGFKGGNGTNSAAIVVESKYIRPNTKIDIKAVGGNGGKGGNGGPGQNGGFGGRGGTGGKGGDGDCFHWIYKGRNGGSGGNGGDGGAGGNGGRGGDGGAGGNGGDIRVWVVNPYKYDSNFYINIDMDTAGGKGGFGGIGGPGGIGGAGGKGGSGGAGGNAFIVEDGKKGANGKDGKRGVDGEKGPDGSIGPDGEPGKKQVFDLARVTPRDDDFYRLPTTRNNRNKRAQTLKLMKSLLQEEITKKRLEKKTFSNSLM